MVEMLCAEKNLGAMKMPETKFSQAAKTPTPLYRSERFFAAMEKLGGSRYSLKKREASAGEGVEPSREPK